MRTLIAFLIAPALNLTGFRFSKGYRHGTTRFHRAVYACVDTVGANVRADGEQVSEGFAELAFAFPPLLSVLLIAFYILSLGTWN